jgi:hypothetical protein
MEVLPFGTTIGSTNMAKKLTYDRVIGPYSILSLDILQKFKTRV